MKLCGWIFKPWNGEPSLTGEMPKVFPRTAPEHPPQAIGLAAPTWQPLQDHCATPEWLYVLCILVACYGLFDLFHRDVMLKDFLVHNTSHSMILICLHAFAFHFEAVPKLVSHSLTQMGSISSVPSSALKLVKVAPVSQDFWNFAPAAKAT